MLGEKRGVSLKTMAVLLLRDQGYVHILRDWMCIWCSYPPNNQHLQPWDKENYHLQKCLGLRMCDHSQEFFDTYINPIHYWVSGILVWSFLVGNEFQSTNHRPLNKLIHFGGNKSPETLKHFKHVTWNHAYPISSDALKFTRFLRPLITCCINKRRTTSISIYIQSPKKSKE